MVLSRRGLLTGLAGVALLTGCSRDHPAVTSGRRRYGHDPQQHADLRLPSGTPLATVVLIHGGYWQAEYGSDQMDPLARKLVELGYATWNVEYRRVGTGGGYPNTLEDVARAVDAVPEHLAHKVVVLGHSAGGHLAGWAAGRTDRTPGGPARVPLTSVISLSGLLDLSDAALEPVSQYPVRHFMGGAPTQVPDRYAVADPALLVPASCPVVACQAEDERVIPTDQASRYLAASRAAGGEASYVALPGNHFDLINPDAAAFPVVRRLVDEAVEH